MARGRDDGGKKRPARARKRKKQPPPFRVSFENVPLNGHIRRGQVVIFGQDGKPVHQDRINPGEADQRRKFACDAAPKLGVDADDVLARVEEDWNTAYQAHRQEEQAEAQDDSLLGRVRRLLKAGNAESVYLDDVLMGEMAAVAAEDQAGYAAVRALFREYRASTQDLERALRPLVQAIRQQHAAARAVEAQGEGAATRPWEGVRIPDGYEITGDGCVRELPPGEDQAARALTRCPVWVEGLTRSHRGEGWGHALVWVDRDGGTHRAAVPAARFHEPGSPLVQELADGGLIVVPGQEKALLRYLTAFDVRERFRSVTQTGWLDDPVPTVPTVPTVYVMPQEVIGAAGGAERYVYQPEAHLPTVTTMRKAGTLSGWQDQVAARCGGNPVLVFGLCASLEPPLLLHAGLEGGGFHLFGRSSRGKTTWLQVAASVWGCGADPSEAPALAFVRKWNTTGNAVEALAAAHRDCLLALDEIGEAQARDLGRVIYQLAGGVGKSRLASNTALRPVRTWRLLTLSTGETQVRSVIESEGQRVRGGQLVRMVDVPAIAPDGRGIVETPSGQEAAAFVAALKRACAEHYGAAGPEFVRTLIDEAVAGDLQARLREQLDRTVQELLRPHQVRFPRGGVPEEIGRVARRFALADVAGRLACQARILPFTAEQVRGAVAEVFSRWLAAYGHGGDMGRALAQLRDFILRNGARFRDRNNSEQIVPNLAGYRDAEQDLYLFTPDGMREALDGYAPQDVARHLFNNGWLDRPESGNRLLCNFRVTGFDRPLRLYGVRAAFLAHVGESNVDTVPTVSGGNGGNGGNGTP
jgi:uncharacterized protein (DUF927 family)